MKTKVNVPSKSNKEKTEKTLYFVGILSATDVKSRIRIRKSVVQILGSATRTKISRIHKTDWYRNILFFKIYLFFFFNWLNFRQSRIQTGMINFSGQHILSRRAEEWIILLCIGAFLYTEHLTVSCWFLISSGWRGGWGENRRGRVGWVEARGRRRRMKGVEWWEAVR